MSEIKKISVDGVIYDLPSSSSENPGEDIQSQIDSLSTKTEELGSKVEEVEGKIESEASRVDDMINQVNENVASSIQTLNDNMVQAINTINGGIQAEVELRESGDSELEKKLEEEKTLREEGDSSVEAKVEEEKSAREQAISEVTENLETSVKTLNETIATVNENVASSIQTLNDNMVQAINTINGGIDNEIRPELDKAVKYTEFGEGRKTIQLDNYDSLSGLDTEGQGFNLAMVSKWNKADFGSAGIQMNLNSSGRVTVNDTEELAYMSDIATDQDLEDLKAKVEENSEAITKTNEDLVSAVSGLNESITTKTEEINTRIDTEVLQKLSDIEENKVDLVETDKNGIITKNIVLENYASLLGKDTQGSLYNLAMVSKWNKADFGSAGIVLNFNGSAERPTYNDDKELALLEDITGNMSEIQLVKKSDLMYELQVGDKIAGTINIPEDQFFKGSEYNEETHVLTLTFKTEDGDQSQNIDLSGLVDVYSAGNGLSLEGGSFAIKLDPGTDAYLEVTADGLRLVGVKEAIDAEAEARSAKDTELQGNIESEAAARIEKDSELEEAISEKVSWTNIETEENPGRKSIVLPNHDTILGTTTSGTTQNLIMMSKWDKVDVGTSQNEINLNGSAERPTYNDDKELALMEDIEGIKRSIEIHIPIRSLKDQVYSKEDILGWFGVEDEVALKVLINTEGPVYINFGIILSTNPYDYKIPVQYIAFETSTQIKLVAIGLDTNNDAPVKYEIVMNLDGTIIEGNSNVKMVLTNLATEENIEAAKPDLSGLATKEELGEVSEKVDSIVVPTKVSELENDLQYQTSSQVDSRIQEVIGSAPEALDTLKELADSLGGDPDFAGTVTTELSKKADKSELTGLASEEWVEGQGYLTEHQDISGLATKSELQKVANSKLYYPGVKVDTQKLFALTKESSEDDIKAALKIAVSSGSYTLPTSAILDECLGKGYQLLSNWMPVSVAWNGAAYVFYIVGQSYMMKPTGLYTVAISISAEGTYSVFQAAKCEEFADTESLKAYQTIDVLTPEDTFASAQEKVASGVKTIVDSDGLQWFITQAYEGTVGSINALKVVAMRVKSPYITTDTIQSGYGITFAQFTLSEGAGANSWSKVTTNKEFLSDSDVNSAIDAKLEGINSSLAVLSDKVTLLENKYNSLVLGESEAVSNFTGGDSINDSSKMYSVSEASIENSSVISAKSLVVNDSSVTNNARLKVNAGDVEFNNLNVSGEFPKANGNAVISINDSDYVVFKDMTFDSSNIYNGIEIGLNSEKLPKNILFDNCKFTGNFSNNAILIFGTQNNATITLNNCYFEKVSNVLRLSNKTNASGVVVNIVNCSVDQWDTIAPWPGFLICQDYTSTGTEEIEANNLFGDGKITVNFINLTYKGEKLLPSNLSRVCGTGDDNQIVYVWAEAKDGSNARPYSEEEYPTITFK